MTSDRRSDIHVNPKTGTFMLLKFAVAEIERIFSNILSNMDTRILAVYCQLVLYVLRLLSHANKFCHGFQI